MQFGAAIFFTDSSMSQGDLGWAAESADFESLWAAGSILHPRCAPNRLGAAVSCRKHT